MEDCSVCLSPVLSDGVQCEHCERCVHKACTHSVESVDDRPCLLCKVCFSKSANVPRMRFPNKRPGLPAGLPVEGPVTANAECPLVPLTATPSQDDVRQLDGKKHMSTVNISSPSGDQSVTDSHAVMAAGTGSAPRPNKVCFARCARSVHLDCVLSAFSIHYGFCCC